MHMDSSATSRTKLCYICEATAGGVRKHLRELIRVFARPEEGFEVHALLGDRGEPGLAQEMEGFRRAGVRVEILTELQRPLRPAQDWRAYGMLKERLGALKPGLVHTHSSKGGFLGRMAAHAAGVPWIIHTPHVFPFQWAAGLKRSFYLALERHAARRCHAIVCVGPGQREEGLRLGLAPEEKFILIPNGVALPEQPAPEAVRRLRSELHVPEEAEVVGMIARLAPQKGVGAFVDAAARVVRARPKAVFVLVGGGPLEHETRARAAAAGLDRDHMKILGHREDAERLYPAFDALVLSSLYEGLPYVLLEAMACGVPVVATDVAGSRDVIADEASGLLARSGDAGDLARNILRILDEPGLRDRLKQGARERVRENFSFERFVEGHRRLYRGEAGNAQPPNTTTQDSPRRHGGTENYFLL